MRSIKYHLDNPFPIYGADLSNLPADLIFGVCFNCGDKSHQLDQCILPREQECINYNLSLVQAYKEQKDEASYNIYSQRAQSVHNGRFASLTPNNNTQGFFKGNRDNRYGNKPKYNKDGQGGYISPYQYRSKY
eukprot:GAHX01000384.1.p1 GENE.GAHX01000384.1~~GAHX01000384.1.p1  ORF type:complete len:146 (-),score=28.43 GAHX01000384.1:28-426(-)